MEELSHCEGLDVPLMPEPVWQVDSRLGVQKELKATWGWAATKLPMPERAPARATLGVSRRAALLRA